MQTLQDTVWVCSFPCYRCFCFKWKPDRGCLERNAVGISTTMESLCVGMTCSGSGVLQGCRSGRRHRQRRRLEARRLQSRHNQFEFAHSRRHGDAAVGIIVRFLREISCLDGSEALVARGVNLCREWGGCNDRVKRCWNTRICSPTS